MRGTIGFLSHILQTPGEGEGGGAPGARTEIPHAGTSGCLRGGCNPVRSPCWSKVLAGPADPRRQEPMLEQVSCSTCDPIEDPQ